MMNARHTFVAIGCVILYIFAWVFSLRRIIGMHFWDLNYVREHYYAATNTTNNNETTTVIQVPPESFFSTHRYIYYLPHILGAIVWWNLYFLQLIPKVRHAYNKKFHRILGRVLMLAALLQAMSGIGLSLTQSSHIILFCSCLLGVAVLYCLCHAYYFAKTRQIPKHKHWVLRMVGYLQAIALQRVYFSGILKFTYFGLNWHGLYPPAETEQEYTQVFTSMLDDSFVLSIFTAFLLTEWYLAAEQGMTDLQTVEEQQQDDHEPVPVDTTMARHDQQSKGENEPLLPK